MLEHSARSVELDDARQREPLEAGRGRSRLGPKPG